jgi:hypothetical protein
VSEKRMFGAVVRYAVNQHRERTAILI